MGHYRHEEMSEAEYQGYLQMGDGGETGDVVVDFYLSAYPFLPAAIKLLIRLRSDTWMTQAGELLKPSEMEISHAQNTVRWLERRAQMILIAAQAESAYTVTRHDLQEVDALDYLRRLPLYQAILARSQEPLKVAN